MANTRQGPDGYPIGDPEGDLDYVARTAGPMAVAAETGPTKEQLFSQQFDWVPHSAGEITIALEGLETSVNKAARVRIAAVDGVLERARGYKSEAARDGIILRRGFAEPNEMDSLSADTIIGDDQVLRILAKHQLLKSSLESGKWPVKKGQSFEKKLQPLILGLYSFSAEDLITTWHESFDSAIGCDRFWLGQLNGVKDNPHVQEAEREHHQRVARR